MIELRWLDGVLQYRFRAPLGTTYFSDFPLTAWPWSEWIDAEHEVERKPLDK